MDKVLVFAGTKEGRILAEYLCEFYKEVHISVATEYGEEVLTPRQELVIHRGRLDLNEMEELLKKQKWDAVIDATHPYAAQVSENIKKACEDTGYEYLRLLREEESPADDVYYVDSKEEAAAYLNQQTGNILLTTGSKDLPDYANLIKDTSRIYARILADGDTVNQCRKLGLSGSQIICMQGPFSVALNQAMIEQVQAKFLVTKDTGKVGGFLEKIQGAKKAGAAVVVIKRPAKETGYGMAELLEYLNLPAMKGKQTVTLVGIGMGSTQGMTLEVHQACKEADVILGASRMLAALETYHKPMQAIYQPEKIMEFLKDHPQYQKVVVAFSGDVGFYSGAEKLLKELKKEKIETRLLCGISSVVYAASKMQMPWQDMKLASVHGRNQNLIGQVRRNEKTFSLIGGKEGVQALAHELLDYKMTDITMHVACQLSYPEETILVGTPENFLEYNLEGLSVVLLENPKAKNTIITHGISDESFIRGEVPMTKEEIRSISLSKLALTKNAVVYDIGAGTGSIGIECALQIPQGQVYAIEKKEEALKLLEKNKYSLGAANLQIVAGEAPQACAELPAPTHAFIGGSSGNMGEIITMLLAKNPRVRIVVNAIALETMAEVTEIMKQFAFAEAIQVSVAKSKALGKYHMMMGQNPIYIITMQNA